MKEEQIKAVCNWLESLLVRNIKVFLGFANFYQRFIKRFNRLAAPLISMLKTPTTGLKNENLEQGN